MRTTYWLYFIASGLLFAVGFVHSLFFWTFIPAFVLFYVALERTQKTFSIFYGGLLAGTGIYLGSFYWVWSTIPIQWMHDQPIWLHIVAVLFYWLLTSTVCGIGCGVFALVAKRYMHDALQFMMIAPIAWVFSEIVRSLFFSVYTMGEGSIVSADFSFGYIGYHLAATPVTLWLSSVAGVYGLSYLASLAGGATYWFVRGTRSQKAHAAFVAAVVVVFFAAFALISGLPKHETLSIDVISIDTMFDKHFNGIEGAADMKKEALLDALQTALSYDPHSIIFPEDARISDYFASADELFTWIDAHSNGSTVSIVDNGPQVDARGTTVVRTYLYDIEQKEVYFFDKKYLVPQGEFMSYLHSFIVGMFVEDEEFGRIQSETRMQAGVVDDSSSVPGYLPGVLFCFETMVPLSVKRIESLRPHPFIAHSISHSWFAQPRALEYQLALMMKVHAVWNGVSIVSAGNMAQGMHYMPSGNVEEGSVLEQSNWWTIRLFTL